MSTATRRDRTNRGKISISIRAATRDRLALLAVERNVSMASLLDAAPLPTPEQVAAIRAADPHGRMLRRGRRKPAPIVAVRRVPDGRAGRRRR